MLNLEDDIKVDAPIDFVGKYQPNTFRGGGYAHGVKPEVYNGFESPIPANNNVDAPKKRKEKANK